MQSDGTIVQLDPEEAKKLRAAFEKGKDTGLVPISDAELPAVKAMNRHDRRAWYARQKREAKRNASRLAKGEQGDG